MNLPQRLPLSMFVHILRRDIIYLFRMAQLNTVHIKIYTRFLFSEVLIGVSQNYQLDRGLGHHWSVQVTHLIILRH